MLQTAHRTRQAGLRATAGHRVRGGPAKRAQGAVAEGSEWQVKTENRLKIAVFLWGMILTDTNSVFIPATLQQSEQGIAIHRNMMG